VLVGPFILFVFFFSSRRRHTRSKRDWSSDVCSSDLHCSRRPFRLSYRQNKTKAAGPRRKRLTLSERRSPTMKKPLRLSPLAMTRSEERRVGKECRTGWAP